MLCKSKNNIHYELHGYDENFFKRVVMLNHDSEYP